MYMCVSLHVQVYVCMHVWRVSDYGDDKEDLRSMDVCPCCNRVCM